MLIFNPFIVGRQSEKPDATGKLVSLYHPEVYEDESESVIDFDFDLFCFAIDTGQPKLTHGIVESEDVYILDDYELYDLIGKEVSIYRLAGTRAWEIWIVPEYIDYAGICEYQSLIY